MRVETPTKSSADRISRRLIIAAVLLGCALRVSAIGRHPLWGDEAVTFDAAALSEDVVVDHGQDQHPLTFYYLCRVLKDVLVGSDTTFRLPSVVFSIGALLLWPVCLRLLRVPIGVRVWCVALLACVPVEIRYAHEARAYALAQFLGVAVLTAYAWARCAPHWPRLVVLAVATVLSSHVDGIGLVVPVSVLVVSLWEARRDAGLRRVAGVLLLGMALAAPYYTFRIVYMSAVGSHEIGYQSLSALWVVDTLTQLSPFGYGAGVIPGALWPGGGARVLMGVILAGALFYMILRRETRWSRTVGAVAIAVLCAATLGFAPRGLQQAVFVLLVVGALVGLVVRRIAGSAPLVVLATLPAAAFLLVCGLLGVPFWYRYLLVTLPGLVFLTALGAAQLGARARGIALAVLVLVPSAYSVCELARPFERADHRGMAQAIVPAMQPGDGVIGEAVLDYPLARLGPLRAYAWRWGREIEPDDCHEYRTAPDAEHEVLAMSRPTGWADADEQEALAHFIARRPSGRVWVISSETEGGRPLDLSPICRPVRCYRFRDCEAQLWQVTAAAHATSRQR